MPQPLASRLRNLQQYTEDLPVNPLIAMRTTLGLKQSEYALLLKVNRSVVSAAEGGMFQLIPSSYRARISDIKAVNKEYQAHRKHKRLYYWDTTFSDWPATPASSQPMQALLTHFDLTHWPFAEKSCVHAMDIWKMTEGATQATQNFVEFLDHLGILKLYPNWLTQFNAALRSDNPVTLKTA